MAALQKIRSWGPILVGVIALALFAFIAEEVVRSFQATKNESRQRIGEIYGNTINVQEFQTLVDEYSEVVKFTSGMSSLNDEQLTQLRDNVWQTYVNNQIIQHEADKLGLTVTDTEMQSVITQGTHPLLMRTPFYNEQTKAFDVNLLKKFLADYKNMQTQPDQMPAEAIEYYTRLYKFWSFVEKNLRENLLAEKYQALLSKSIISNPISAKMAFEGRVNEKDIVMAAVPFSSIADNTITVEDKDLKAKYEEMKELFKQDVETRDIKYIDVAVKASAADKKALDAEMDEYNQKLAEGGNMAKLVRESGSVIAYSALPVSKNALPRDIASQLDSMTTGTQKGPYYNAGDNTMNIIKLIAKVSAPDSVEVRQIQVVAADEAAIRKTADSILTALNAGTPFDSIAKRYNQSGAKNWITSAQYEGNALDEDSRKYFSTINSLGVNAIEKIELTQGTLITQVTDRRAMIDKYDIAIVKRPVEFSKETYTKAYNDFSQFLAANSTLDEIEANASKKGYTVLMRNDMGNYEHYVANVPSTREALRWVFNEDTEVGDVSPLYECGNNDHMMVVILTGTHPKGYRAWDDVNVKAFLTQEVLKEKKAKQIEEMMNGKTSIAAVAQLKGAVSDSIKHITFSSSAFIPATGQSEPALSGAVSQAAKGKFVNGIKGNGGVYAFQVTGENKRNEKFDEKTEQQQLNSRNMRIAFSRFISELTEKANVKDNRYLFF